MDWITAEEIEIAESALESDRMEALMKDDDQEECEEETCGDFL